jgi:hypothetical protein
MNILDKCFTKEKDLVSRDVAGERIIVPIKGHVGDLEGVFTLNELGTMIWQLINGQTTARELVEAVRNEYDVEAAEAELSRGCWAHQAFRSGITHGNG